MTSINSYSKIQKGIFCYLNNRGLTIAQMRGSIKKFHKDNNELITNTFDDKQQYVCDNFDKFKKFIKETFVISYDSHTNSYEETNKEIFKSL